jgi:hypothetical protein
MAESCAPAKNFTHGTCFDIDSLKLIADAYNKNNDDKIEINDSKPFLSKQIKEKFASVCPDEETCLLKQDLIKKLDSKEINDKTFRPSGPYVGFDWLSNFDIQNVIKQYQDKYTDFLFLGAVPIDFDDLPELGIKSLDFDFLTKKGKTKLGIVFNTDPHYKGGQHWISLFTNLSKGQIYFFDSTGKSPPQEVKRFISKLVKHIYKLKFNEKIKINDIINKLKSNDLNDNKIKKLYEIDIRYNQNKHQTGGSECGVYSINFITSNLGDTTFDEIVETITEDKEINKLRPVFFRKP